MRVEGSWWTARYSFLSHLERKTRWSGETECCFPLPCFGLKWRYAVPTLTHSSSWISLTFSTYLFYGDRFIINFPVLSQNQGPCYGYKVLHSGAAFSTYITLLPWCHVFLFCGHASAPVSQLHCGLWLPCSSLFGVWHLIYQVCQFWKMVISHREELCMDMCLINAVFWWLSYLCSWSPCSAVEKQVISLCFLYILLFETQLLLFLYYKQVIYN